MNKSISRQPGRIGPLTYTPPKELGAGKEIPAWGRGGFGFERAQSHARGSAPEIRGSTTCVPVTWARARAIADWIDHHFDTDPARPGAPSTAREWVEAVIADLPAALDEAIGHADQRTNELRRMKAAATGDPDV